MSHQWTQSWCTMQHCDCRSEASAHVMLAVQHLCAFIQSCMQCRAAATAATVHLRVLKCEARGVRLGKHCSWALQLPCNLVPSHPPPRLKCVSIYSFADKAWLQRQQLLWLVASNRSAAEPMSATFTWQMLQRLQYCMQEAILLI